MITRLEAFMLTTENLRMGFPEAYKLTENWLENLWDTIRLKAINREYILQIDIPQKCMPFAQYIQFQIKKAEFDVWREDDYLLIRWH